MACTTWGTYSRPSACTSVSARPGGHRAGSTRTATAAPRTSPASSLWRPIWGSAVLAAIQSYDKLRSGRGTTHLTLGMLAAFIGIVGNQLVARYKGRVGREIRSAPLIVDARHSWLDAIASFGALVGLIGVALGFRQADPLAGFAITVLIVRIGIEATHDVVARLMDVNDGELAGEVARVVRTIPGVSSVSDVRIRWLGRQAEMRLVIHVAATMPITEAHELAHRVQERLRVEHPDAREIMVEPAPSIADEGSLTTTAS